MAYDAIVVGGGVVGASVAYHLVAAGATTLLVDREDTAGQPARARAFSRRKPARAMATPGFRLRWRRSVIIRR